MNTAIDIFENLSATLLAKASDLWPAVINRAVALGILLPCAALLAIAAILHPVADGLGTHQQLGLGPCGFLVATGMPCITCGMTTSFTYAVHGQILLAFVTQPAGALLCLLATITGIISVYAAWFGISLAPLGKLIWRRNVILTAVIILFTAWGYNAIMHLYFYPL